MSKQSNRQNDEIHVSDAPTIPGLTFRHYRGEVDFAAMVQVIEGSKAVDQIERSISVEDIKRSFAHLVNCDPYKDVLLVEIEGNPVGYSRVWWHKEQDNELIYYHFAYLLPAWRGKGIRRVLLRKNEQRLREIAAGHSVDDLHFFRAWALDTEKDWKSLLIDEEYQPERYFFEMVRPDLEKLPDIPLPDGLEIRPVQPEQVRTIWKAAEEAFRDHWGACEWKDEWLREWQEDPTYNPGLWQVAWDGDQVAGMVLNFIDDKENREYNRLRGYTENISVRRPWRKRGLARALIAQSFSVLKNQGMTEAALGVDTHNPSGALRLYEGMGLKVVKREAAYRKVLD